MKLSSWMQTTKLVCAVASVVFPAARAHLLRGLEKGDSNAAVNLPPLVPGIPLTLSVSENQYLDWFLDIQDVPSTFECTVHASDGSLFLDLTLAPGSNHGEETHFCLEYPSGVNGTEVMTCRTDIFPSPFPLLVRLRSYVAMDEVVLDCHHMVPSALEPGLPSDSFDLDTGKFQSFVVDTTSILTMEDGAGDDYVNCSLSSDEGDPVMFIYEVKPANSNQTSHNSVCIAGLLHSTCDVLVPSSDDVSQLFIAVDSWGAAENVTVACEAGSMKNRTTQ
ncbi:expressed unknown protein [Seminavis robusta]|uniref:Uncharacterized protein n=1 Tax=Seminavis robusta TaxID=568900 RepID=A0A9N8DEW8_9STRA|nr:expressed unknown protein [Seminavis robusta]|eukprot:Sro62_g035370.1 n/a (277) ;mRNA; r:61379-62209